MQQSLFFSIVKSKSVIQKHPRKSPDYTAHKIEATIKYEVSSNYGVVFAWVFFFFKIYFAYAFEKLLYEITPLKTSQQGKRERKK